jgi:hypothetical protein
MLVFLAGQIIFYQDVRTIRISTMKNAVPSLPGVPDPLPLIIPVNMNRHEFSALNENTSKSNSRHTAGFRSEFPTYLAPLLLLFVDVTRE